MEIALVIQGIALLALGILLFASSRTRSKNPESEKFIQNDLANLRRDLATLQTELTRTVDTKMDRNQSSMQAQLKESAKIVTEVSNRLTKLDETNKRVVDVTSELKTLQNVLLNPKQRGNFGEFQLSSVLENFFPPNQWQSQYKFKNGDAVDAAVFLKDKQILPIDSKFSLENYNRMIDEKDSDRKKLLLKKVRDDMKLRIDETAKYIRPAENTMDFAFMFVPSEALYYDMLIARVGEDGGNSRDLIEYAFRDKHVIIVSPTTFVAYLQTVLQGLRSLQIEEQAKDIQVRVGQLGAHIHKYDEYMVKLGNSLGTTVNHYNNASKEFKKVDRDVVKIAGGKETIEPLLIDKPQDE